MITYRGKLAQCFLGKIIWGRLRSRSIHHDSVGVIVIPEDDCRIMEYMQKYLFRLLDERHWESIVLILPGKRKRNAVCYAENVKAVYHWPVYKIRALLQYYRLSDLDGRLIVASFDIPEGRNGTRLIGLKGLTAEKLFCAGVLEVCDV